MKHISTNQGHKYCIANQPLQLRFGKLADDVSIGALEQALARDHRMADRRDALRQQMLIANHVSLHLEIIQHRPSLQSWETIFSSQLIRREAPPRYTN